MNDENSLIVYYSIGGASIICTCFVIFSIFKFGCETTPTRLVLLLHLTVLVESISSFPKLYTGNDGLCAFIGFLRCYFGLANAFVLLMMVLHYRYIFLVDNYNVKLLIARHLEKVIFLLPLITCLPWTTLSYG